METRASDRSVSLRRVLRVLCKRKKMMLLLFASTVTTMAVGALVMRPVYHATSTIMVDWEKDAEKTLIIELNWWLRRSNYDQIAAEMQILKSRPIAERVVKALGLANPAGTAADSARFAQVVAAVQKGLKVEQTKETNLLQVTYADSDPKRAALIANCIVEQYARHRAELAKDLRTYAFFDEQIKMAAAKLDELERREADFKRREGMVVLEGEAEILYKKLADFDQALTEVRTKRIGKESKLRVFREGLAGNGAVVIPSTETSDSPSREEYLSRLKAELLSLELERNRLRQRYTASHPQLVAAERQVALVQEKLRQELREIIAEEETNLRALRAEEASLEAKIAEVQGQLKRFAVSAYELSRISRGIKETQELYSILLKQREEARLAASRQDQLVQVKVVSPAVPPHAPARPNRPLYLLVSLLLGGVVAVGSAFFAESLDRSIDSVEDVRRDLGFPVLASLAESEFLLLGSSNPGKRIGGAHPMAEQPVGTNGTRR
ncbi:MAG: GumC family protein [candidate division KSB1 bacterium]|nr:GumC family protein [candidate division KSB1 bacterium]